MTVETDPRGGTTGADAPPALSSAPRQAGFGLLPKFLITLLALMAMMSVAISLNFMRVMSRRLVQDLESRGNYLVRSLAKAGQYGVFTRFPEILNPIAEGAFAAGDVFFVEIVDIDGHPLITKVADDFDPALIRPISTGVVEHLELDRPAVDRLDHADKPRYEFTFPVTIERAAFTEEEIVAGQGPSPKVASTELIGAVRVGLSLEPLQRELTRTQTQVVAITVLIVAMAFVVIVAFLRRVIGPVTKLAEGARRISEGDFSIRVDSAHRDEIGLLANAFNEMSDRIQHFHQELERKVDERTEALAEKTRDMEEFVYTVSHDLKAPVVSTHGLISLLAEEAGSELNDDARLYIERIQANASHMERLIQDLLQMSRIDRPAKPRELVDTGELIQDILLEHDAQIRETGIRVEVASNIPDAYGERDRLVQVFDNLIANALKFRRPESPGRIEIGGASEDDHTRFWVRDDGIGIDESHHERIFGLFQRLHSDREYQGTGLGLAIVKKIVEKHGGRIWLESTPNRGSTFSFTLPHGPHDPSPNRPDKDVMLEDSVRSVTGGRRP